MDLEKTGVAMLHLLLCQDPTQTKVLGAAQGLRYHLFWAYKVFEAPQAALLGISLLRHIGMLHMGYCRTKADIGLAPELSIRDPAVAPKVLMVIS